MNVELIEQVVNLIFWTVILIGIPVGTIYESMKGGE
jgi:hypothetical protein